MRETLIKLMDYLTPSISLYVSQNLVNGEWTEPRAKRKVFIYHEGTIFVNSCCSVQLSEVRNSDFCVLLSCRLDVSVFQYINCSIRMT